MSEKMQLASLFPEVSTEHWRNQVEKLLKGREFDTLLNTSSDGFRLQPLYGADETDRGAHGEGDRRRGVANSGGAWQILERALHPNPDVANRALLHGLSRGATALQLVLAPDVYDQTPGVRVVNRDDLGTLLKDVTVDALPILLDAGPHASAYGDRLMTLALERAANTADLQIYVGCDPAAALASDGCLPGGREEIYACAAAQAKQFSRAAPRSRALAADGRPYHAAGASDAQELAAVIAAALQHLRALEAVGLSAQEGATQLLFRIALDADIFAGVAKQRALRILWSNVCSECGCVEAADNLLVHAETATRMLHSFEPWINQLRATSATLAAALGGAQFVSTHGYDETAALPSTLAQRCARNNQLVLQQESHLYAVVDPMGGSGYAEAYTEQLVQASWLELQQLEREGGLIASLKKGHLQARIEAVKTERLQKIASRELPLTGISEFPNLEDTPASGQIIDWSAELSAAAARIDTQMIEFPDGAPELANALTPAPLGEQFEALRLQALNAKTPPVAALITLGNKAQFAARAAFVGNLLAAGGVHSASCGEVIGVEPALDAWRSSESTVAILCGDDNCYEQSALTTVTALRQAGCQHIYLAGNAKALTEQLDAAGVKAYITKGMNAVAFLKQIHADLGVQS